MDEERMMSYHWHQCFMFLLAFDVDGCVTGINVHSYKYTAKS